MNIQPNIRFSFVDFAEQTLASEPSKSLTRYALESLLGYLRETGADDLEEHVVREWIARMSIEGKKSSTCKRYFTKVQAVYKHWLGDGCSGTFDSLAKFIDSLKETSDRNVSRNGEMVKRLFGRNERSDDWQTVCICLYLLYNPMASLADVVDLTFDSAPQFCPQIADIINSFDSSHGRKYVFALKQGKSRPNEICRKLTRQLQDLLTSVGMKFEYGFSRSSITAIWIDAALKANVALSGIRSCVGAIPPEYPALSLVGRSDFPVVDKENIICQVADSINCHAKRWFAMKLRSGVKAENIEEAIKECLPGRLNTIELFYPTRAEVRKANKKRIVENIPILPDILFFKSTRDRVKSLFASIGNLAWCFRTTSAPDSDYSVISHREMLSFQRCIGQFTEDMRMELIDTGQQLVRGRRVKITGGMMAGYQGEIIDVENEPGKRVFFLSIANYKKARWTAEVEDVFIQPLD